MGRKFKIIRDYYEEGEYLYKKRIIEFQKGLTVLVGCNGSGKTTLMKQLKEQLSEDEDVAYIFYDNLHDGGINSRSEALHMGDIQFFAMSSVSSEGESIVLDLQKTAKKIGNMIRSNTDKKEFWILLDAVDSGMSVDAVEDLKEGLFKSLLEYYEDKDIYIIVSANEYEMARGEACFDVVRGKYVSIKSYDKYRSVIMKSRQEKDKRFGTDSSVGE